TLRGRGVGELTDEQVRALKLALARRLAPAATVIMLDAELGADALRAGAVPSSVGLVMPLEAQGYETGGDDRITTLLPDFGPTAAAAGGADACKLRAPSRAARGSAAPRDAVIRETVEACHAVGLPLVVEPVVHRTSTETEAAFASGYASLVLAAVARIAP